MKTLKRSRRRIRSALRKGTAAVECAIMAPLLTLLVLGAMDVGQFANVHQKISDASREGARMAARNSTQSTSDVQVVVMDYLERVSRGVSPDTLASATTVTVTRADGGSISGTALGDVPSGSEVRVQVTLQFEAIRWISGVSSLTGSQITSTTIMRRQ